ncbi:MAG: hypothetical protein ACK559_21970, partial [bacterium]
MDAFDIGIAVEKGLGFGLAAGEHQTHARILPWSARQFGEAAVEFVDQLRHLRRGGGGADEHPVVERGDQHPAIEK